jgi:hypothetical protein
MHTSVSVKVYIRTSSWEDGLTNVSFLAFTCMVLSLVIAMSAAGPGQCYSATAHHVYHMLHRMRHFSLRAGRVVVVACRPRGPGMHPITMQTSASVKVYS